MRDIAIQKWKIYSIKIKGVLIIIFFLEIISLDIDTYKSRNGASVSEVLLLFNCSSFGLFQPFIKNIQYQYLVGHPIVEH